MRKVLVAVGAMIAVSVGAWGLIMAGDDHVVPPHVPRSQKITIRIK